MSRLLTSLSIQLLIVALSLAISSSWSAEPPPVRYTKWSSQREVFVPMRDGVRLSTDVMLPEGAVGKLPTILVRTPYDKDRIEWILLGAFLEEYLKQGYAVVMQNERGRLFSEGYYANYLQGASTDGYDTVDWIAKQTWSSGKIGTIGCSSSSEQQWPMAASNNPAHVAMIPVAGGMSIGDIPGNYTRGAMYRGGVPVLGFWAWWYGDLAQSERLQLPPASTQEQRIRLRNSYSLYPKATVRYDPYTEPADVSQLLGLPVKDIMHGTAAGALSPFDQYLTWGAGDKRWTQVEQLGAHAQPRVPALLVDTWQNFLGVGETTRLFKYLQDLNTPNQYLIIGAGPHCAVMSDERRLSLNLKAAAEANPGLKVSDLGALMDFSDLKIGDMDVGDARYGGIDHGYAKLFLRWFDHWLRGLDTHVTDMPKVQLYVMGQGWVFGRKWPLETTHFTKYYLDGGEQNSQGGTLSLRAPTRTGMETYTYDPNSPTPSRGGGCCGIPATSFDQRAIESRRDVLVYSSLALEQPLTIAGPIDVVLYVSSSAKDTDFMVRLVDVYPNGKAVNLSDDAFRVRYRDGYDKNLPMKQDEVYRIELSNMVTGVHFAKGHRIRLDVSSSSFPVYERNLNTGGNNYDETSWVVAENSVHHGGRHSSYVLLPVQ